MNDRDFSSRPAAPARRGRCLALMAVAAFLFLAVISCRTVNRAVVELPDVPGAKYIGSKECEQCHDELYRNFQTADHSRLIAAGPNALNAGCESCHGPCSLHSDSGGEVKPPYSFTSGRPQSSSYGARASLDPPRVDRDGLLPMPRGCSRPVQPAQPPSGSGGKTEMHRVPFAAQGIDSGGGRHVAAFGKRQLHPLPPRPAGPLRL